MQDKKNTIFIIMWLFDVILLLCVCVCMVTSAVTTGADEQSQHGGNRSEAQTAAPQLEIIEKDTECVFYLAQFYPTVEKPEDDTAPCRMQLTDEERYILARIVMAEAEVEDLKGKALVACVVLNRIEYEQEFENTVEGVIFEPGQFSPVRPGCRYWKVEPNEDCYKAVDMVISGWDESHGALYFEGCKSADNWHSRNLKYLFKHGTHRFYKYR